MEGYSRKDEGCHQFLDLVTKERELHGRISDEKLHGFSEEKKLELRLAPPGEDWTNNNKNKNSQNPSRFGPFSDSPCAQNHVLKSPWQQQQQQPASSHFLHLQSQPCSNRAAPDLNKNPEKKTFPPANLAVPNNSAQKRWFSFINFLHPIFFFCLLYLTLFHFMLVVQGSVSHSLCCFISVLCKNQHLFSLCFVVHPLLFIACHMNFLILFSHLVIHSWNF